MCYDFYTRGMIEEAQEHSRNDIRPYDIYSTYDIEGYNEKINWDLVVEKTANNIMICPLKNYKKP